MPDQELSTLRRPGWGHPLSCREIAAMAGVTYQAVHEVEKAALKHLRRLPQVQRLASELGIFPEEP